MPMSAPDDPVIAGLDDDRAPDLAAGHPGGAEDPISRTRSRTFIVSVLMMPRAAMMTAIEAERVEQAEDAVERVADGALDPVEATGRGRGPSLARDLFELAIGGRSASGSKRTANASAPAAPSRRSRRPSRRAAPRRRGPGQRPLGDADDPQVERRPSAAVASSMLADGEAVARRRCAAGTMTAPPASRARQGGGPIARDEVQPAVGGEVRADHRGAVDRTPPTARSNVAIGLTDATPGAPECVRDPLVETDGRIEVRRGRQARRP